MEDNDFINTDAVVPPAYIMPSIDTFLAIEELDKYFKNTTVIYDHFHDIAIRNYT